MQLWRANMYCDYKFLTLASSSFWMQRKSAQNSIFIPLERNHFPFKIASEDYAPNWRALSLLNILAGTRHLKSTCLWVSAECWPFFCLFSSELWRLFILFFWSSVTHSCSAFHITCQRWEWHAQCYHSMRYFVVPMGNFV